MPFSRRPFEVAISAFNQRRESSLRGSLHTSTNTVIISGEFHPTETTALHSPSSTTTSQTYSLTKTNYTGGMFLILWVGIGAVVITDLIILIYHICRRWQNKHSRAQHGIESRASKTQRTINGREILQGRAMAEGNQRVSNRWWKWGCRRLSDTELGRMRLGLQSVMSMSKPDPELQLATANASLAPTAPASIPAGRSPSAPTRPARAVTVGTQPGESPPDYLQEIIPIAYEFTSSLQEGDCFWRGITRDENPPPAYDHIIQDQLHFEDVMDIQEESDCVY